MDPMIPDMSGTGEFSLAKTLSWHIRVSPLVHLSGYRKGIGILSLHNSASKITYRKENDSKNSSSP